MNKTGNSIIDKTNQFIKKHNLDSLKDVALFIIITLVIHYLWRYWANQLHYMPINEFMSDAQKWMANGVFRQSTWFVQKIG